MLDPIRQHWYDIGTNLDAHRLELCAYVLSCWWFPGQNKAEVPGHEDISGWRKCEMTTQQLLKSLAMICTPPGVQTYKGSTIVYIVIGCALDKDESHPMWHSVQ